MGGAQRSGHGPGHLGPAGAWFVADLCLGDMPPGVGGGEDHFQRVTETAVAQAEREQRVSDPRMGRPRSQAARTAPAKDQVGIAVEHWTRDEGQFGGVERTVAVAEAYDVT